MPNSKHLFHIQDEDLPTYVRAETMIEAIEKWRVHVIENSDGVETAESMVDAFPKGVAHVAEPDEIIE